MRDLISTSASRVLLASPSASCSRSIADPKLSTSSKQSCSLCRRNSSSSHLVVSYLMAASSNPLRSSGDVARRKQPNAPAASDSSRQLPELAGPATRTVACPLARRIKAAGTSPAEFKTTTTIAAPSGARAHDRSWANQLGRDAALPSADRVVMDSGSVVGVRTCAALDSRRR